MAINLLKVSEIIPCPPLTRLPESHPHVKGIATLRGASLSVIDLSRAIGERPLEDPNGGCLIVTDVSRSKQGLHVQAVSKIVHCLTTDIRPPPFGSGGVRSYITGVTSVDGTLVQVLDIEKVIHSIAPAQIEMAPTDLSMEDADVLGNARILVVDDSQVALQQSVHTLRNPRPAMLHRPQCQGSHRLPARPARHGPADQPDRFGHRNVGDGRLRVYPYPA